MTDHTLSRADEVLAELVELIETARTLPMSSSCVVPRERTLDLLDLLREVLPPELAEARRLVAHRIRTLSEAERLAEEQLRRAHEQAAATVAAAEAQARAALEATEQQAQASLATAAGRARELVEAARREQEQLVSADSVHQAAAADAARLRSETEQECRSMLAAAGEQAGTLTSEAHGYAYATLSELVENLQQLAATAENGRNALQAPRAGLAAPQPEGTAVPPVEQPGHPLGRSQP